MGDINQLPNNFSHDSLKDFRGVSIWPDLFLHSDNGEELAIVLMNFQGFFNESTMEEKISATNLSLTLSSMQIISTTESLKEENIEQLEIATNLSKLLQEGFQKTTKLFQSLTYLVRYCDNNNYENGYEFGKEYLSNFLKPSKSEHKIEPFDEVNCFLLGNNPENTSLDASARELLHDSRVKYFKDLKKIIKYTLKCENLFKKTILGKDITCAQFKSFIVTNYQNFRDFKPEKVLKSFIDHQIETILTQHMRKYQTDINEDIELNQENFNESLKIRHKNLSQKIIENFRESEKVEDEEILKHCEIFLEYEMKKEFEKWQDKTLEKHKVLMAAKENQASASEVIWLNSKVKKCEKENESMRIKIDHQNDKIMQLTSQVQKLTMLTDKSGMKDWNFS